MADTIRSGNITVAYLDESRQKRISWSGSDDTVFENANTIYSELQDLFDASAQSDDSIPWTAQTPTEYTVGSYSAGEDNDPWYITYDLMERINGGALRTQNWTRITNTNTGIIVVEINQATNTLTTATDVGATLTNNTTETGTLLEIIDDGTNAYLVIRPTDNTATHDWSTGSGTISSSAGANTATQTQAAITGEQVWASFFHQLPVEPDTHMFAYSGSADLDGTRSRITSVNSTTEDWWGDGTFDVCIPIKDWKTSGNPDIDDGYVYWSARKYSTEYAIFEARASTTSGGRSSVPMSTKNDLNNNTGFKSITFTTSAGAWSVGDEITGDSSGARGVITKIDNPGTTQTVHYYLLGQVPTTSDHFGGALTDFDTGIENLNNEDDSGTGTKDGSAPANQGPALTTWFTNNALPTIAFGTYEADIDNDSVDEQYGVLITCNQNPLTEVYEWLKYINRYGATGTSDSDGIAGELYRGGEVYLAFSGSVTGTIAEGGNVTQAGTNATGVIISYNAVDKVLLLRDIRGTFNTAGLVTDNDNSGTFTPDLAAETFAPNGVSPFGTLAGGRFFGSRGVAITDWLTADENSFQLTPIEGGTKARPQAFTITVTNLRGTAATDATADLVAVFELESDGGNINKTQYSSAGSTAQYANTQVVDTTITADTPAAGSIMVRDESDNNKNYLIRYSSYTSSTFSLAEFAAFVASGGSTTTVQYATGGFDGVVQRGDIVCEQTQGEVSYVESVDSDTQITVNPPFTATTNGSTVSINTMPIDDDTLDNVYVVPLHTYPPAATTTASVSIEYVDTYFYKAIVRNNRHTTKIIPFTATGSVSGGTDNQTVQTVRNTDTITS
jgi:hypothetical protein